MNTFQFYHMILEEEKYASRIQYSHIERSLRIVGKAYNRKSLDNGSTYIDFSIPAHRCAYIYKFSIVHTQIVSKYFQKLLKKRSEPLLKLRSTVKKSNLRICCLGGGPGSDAVGLFKVLARYPCFYKTIEDVTVLDICGGWRPTFKRVMEGLKDGLYKDVPATFVDSDTFCATLLGVNLLEPLADNIIRVIEEADIICMVKFVSAILNQPYAEKALQVIQSYIKPGAVVLFIDNFAGGTYGLMETISCHNSLRTVFGPEHKFYYMQGTLPQNITEQYHCHPLMGTRLSVGGWIKDKSFQNSPQANNGCTKWMQKVLETDDWVCDNADYLEKNSNSNELSAVRLEGAPSNRKVQAELWNAKIVAEVTNLNYSSQEDNNSDYYRTESDDDFTRVINFDADFHDLIDNEFTSDFYHKSSRFNGVMLEENRIVTHNEDTNHYDFYPNSNRLTCQHPHNSNSQMATPTEQLDDNIASVVNKIKPASISSSQKLNDSNTFSQSKNLSPDMATQTAIIQVPCQVSSSAHSCSPENACDDHLSNCNLDKESNCFNLLLHCMQNFGSVLGRICCCNLTK